MLWAAFYTTLFGFLRASVFCAPSLHSFDPTTTLCQHDFTITHASGHLMIKVSKANHFCKTCTVTVGSTNTSTYILLQTGNPSHPVFKFEDGSYLTCTSLTSHLSTLLTLAYQDPATYRSHSFRIGAVTIAATVSLPDWQIHVLGMRTSDCYTCTPQAILMESSHTLAAYPPHNML